MKHKKKIRPPPVKLTSKYEWNIDKVGQTEKQQRNKQTDKHTLCEVMTNLTIDIPYNELFLLPLYAMNLRQDRAC